MRRKQAGVTFIGWVVLLIPMALLVYVAIRLIPIYLNHMKVVSTVEQVAAETRIDGMNPVAVRMAIERRFDIESIMDPTMENVRVARDGDGWIIEVGYERVAPMFGGVDLLVTFDKRVAIQ
jgi:hypothetical protein